MKIITGNSSRMKTAKVAEYVVSSCRHCRFYGSEGRRGGQCQQLGVPVQSHWKSCSLASAPFPVADLQRLPEMLVWQNSRLWESASTSGANELAGESPLRPIQVQERSDCQTAMIG
jgi:hypothetical protein